jgi:serine O-acetyltransferase
MKFSECKYLIWSDLYRVAGNACARTFIKQLFFGEAFLYIFWMRIGFFLHQRRVLKLMFYPVVYLALRRLSFQRGISIPSSTKIGSGLFIGHCGGIVVNAQCEIGKNCNISQGVTLGQANRGRHKGSPVVGDNVYIGPGAKIVGAIRIGNHVAIGANCVVTKDIPDNAVVVGIPGKVISYDGSEGYVNRTDYDVDVK